MRKCAKSVEIFLFKDILLKKVEREGKKRSFIKFRIVGLTLLNSSKKFLGPTGLSELKEKFHQTFQFTFFKININLAFW